MAPQVTHIVPMKQLLLDLENRNRHYNLQIFNLLESIEGSELQSLFGKSVAIFIEIKIL